VIGLNIYVIVVQKDEFAKTAEDLIMTEIDRSIKLYFDTSVLDYAWIWDQGREAGYEARFRNHGYVKEPLNKERDTLIISRQFDGVLEAGQSFNKVAPLIYELIHDMSILRDPYMRKIEISFACELDGWASRYVPPTDSRNWFMRMLFPRAISSVLHYSVANGQGKLWVDIVWTDDTDAAMDLLVKAFMLVAYRLDAWENSRAALEPERHCSGPAADSLVAIKKSLRQSILLSPI
jgi:hypothetical protein